MMSPTMSGVMSMVEGSTRWLTYDDTGAALGITTESAKRLAMRHRWPRRPGNDGKALVAVPEERIAQAATGDRADDGRRDDTGDVAHAVTGGAPDDSRGDARALIGYLERRVDELTDQLSEARTEARGFRFEAEGLRVQASQVDVLTALVETERARMADARAEMTVRLDLGRTLLEGVQGERDRLLAEVKERRRSWLGRLVAQLRG